MDPLGHLIEQLWAPVLADGGIRIALNPVDDPDWSTVESYRILPNARRAHLLVPRAGGPMAAASLTNYRDLRLRRKSMARALLGPLSGAGVPLSLDVLAVQVSRERPRSSARLPLHLLGTLLGVHPLFATIGISTGDNRKAVLALLDRRGDPVAHAKVGWNETSDRAVANEASVLRLVGGRKSAMRAPRLLHELDYLGHPLVVTESLPLDVRGSRGRIAPITSAELYALAPVVRHAPLRDTGHFSHLGNRLQMLARHPVSASTASCALPLWRRLAEADPAVPVSARWHGDLTPWNRARDSRGQLWVWDWEDSQEDAAAGLDALHWSFSVQRSPSSKLRRLDLASCLAAAGPHLAAAGANRETWPLTAGAYALTVVDRACALAAEHGGWSSSWISRADLCTLVGQAEHLLSANSIRGADVGAA